jgi:signal transduction histidine kinase
MAGRTQMLLATVIGLGLLLVLVFEVPGSDVALENTEAWLPAYAAAVLIIDLIAVTLLLAQFVVHGVAALLVLAAGYLVAGLLVIPWAMTFPGVFSPSGLLEAGLQTTAAIAAVRRIVFPMALVGYALLQRRKVPAVVDPGRRLPLVMVVTIGSVLLTSFTTWMAVAVERFLPGFMVGPRISTTTWTIVLYVSLALSCFAIVLLLRRRHALLDLWLLVTLAAFVCEILLLGFIGAGVRFSIGWWEGRAFGLISASIVTLVLLAETTTLHARLLQSLLAEARATEARARLLEALSAALAHELNQPLGSIVTSANAATRWLDRPEPDLREVRARLERITSDGHCAAATIDSLRQAFGKQSPRWDLVDPKLPVLEAIRLMRVEVDAAGAHLATDIQEELPKVRGDAVSLRQAVLNLLRNAVDAVAGVERERRTIHTTCRRHGDGVLISVADAGEGITEDAPLFEPFYSTKPQGMGLGLMICRLIAEAHGGQITAGRQLPRGTRFDIFLPASTATKAATDGR